MTRRLLTQFTLLAALGLAACQAGPLGGLPKVKARPALSSSASAVPPEQVAQVLGGLLASPPPGAAVGPGQPPPPLLGGSPAPLASPAARPSPGLVALGQASLAGAFRAPASLISNNSGALISNNSGGLIGDAGAGYRLLAALDERPLAGLRVALLDALGDPVVGADGQDLVAVTDGEGRYAFQGALPPHTLFLSASLPGGKGEVRALVPKEGAQKAVDGHLFSSLTTTYILAQYLQQASDKQAALDRLSAEVVRQTNQGAQAAFLATQAQVPANLGVEATRSAVDALRSGHGPFATQMEAVRKLLIVAGQVGRGEGRLASEVSLEYSTGLGAGPDGSVYFTSYENRIWRIRPDGVLDTLAGGKTGSPPPSVEGLLATDLPLSGAHGVRCDAQGRPHFLEGGRLLRVNPDGRLALVWDQVPGRGHSFSLAGDGTVWLLDGGTWGDNQLWELPPGGTPKAHGTVQKGNMDRVEGFGRNAQGEVFVRIYRSPVDEEGNMGQGPSGPMLAQMNLASGALTPVVGVPTDSQVDDQGRFLWVEGGQVKTKASLSAPTVVVGPAPAEVNVEYLAMGPQGEVFLASYYQIYKVHQGLAQRWGGTDANSNASGNAADYGFQAPAAVVPMPDGRRFVSDKGKGQLLVIDAQGQIRTVTLPGSYPGQEGGKGGGHPILRLGLDGKLYGLSPEVFGAKVQRIDPEAGTLSPLADAPDGYELSDFLVDAQGQIFFLAGDWRAHDLKLWTLTPGATQATALATLSFSLEGGTLAWDRQGRLLIYAPGGFHMPGDPMDPVVDSHQGLMRWSQAGGLELLGDPHFTLPGDGNDSSIRAAMTVDPQGRVLGVSGNRLLRVTLGSDAEPEVLAGEGGKAFSGTGVDDSLDQPACPAFDAEGGLLLVDQGHRQVKRIPPALLN